MEVRCLVKELLAMEAEAAALSLFLGRWLSSRWRGFPWCRSWWVGFPRWLLRGRDIGLLCPWEGVEFREESIGLDCLSDGDRAMAGGLLAAYVLAIRKKREVTRDPRRINAGASLALGSQRWRG